MARSGIAALGLQGPRGRLLSRERFYDPGFCIFGDEWTFMMGLIAILLGSRGGYVRVR